MSAPTMQSDMQRLRRLASPATSRVGGTASPISTSVRTRGQSVPSLARLAASGARSTSARTCESGWLAGAAADDATAARRSSLCAKSCSRMGAGSESLSHTSGSWPSRSRRRQVPSAAHASDVGRAARMAASMSSGKPSSVSGGSSSAAHERRTALSPLAPPPKPIMRRLSGAS